MNKAQKTISTIILSLFFAITGILPFTEVNEVSAKTTIPQIMVLNAYNLSMAIDDTFILIAPNTGLIHPTFKSSKSSVASVDGYGVITANAAGSCTITVKAGKASAKCKIKVKKPDIQISQTSITLENGARKQLGAKISTGNNIKWSSSKSSVCTVEDDGLITAIKPGTAYIKAAADGVSTKCKVVVKKPTVKLTSDYLTMNPGDYRTLGCKVSSGLTPAFSSSNARVATVDAKGIVHAVDVGKAYIYAKIDGVKVTCKVTVEL